MICGGHCLAGDDPFRLPAAHADSLSGPTFRYKRGPVVRGKMLLLSVRYELVWLVYYRRRACDAQTQETAYSLTLQEANEHKILLLTVGSEPRTLDPQEAQGVTEHHIIMAMIEGLVAPSIDDQSKVVPGYGGSLGTQRRLFCLDISHRGRPKVV